MVAKGKKIVNKVQKGFHLKKRILLAMLLFAIIALVFASIIKYQSIAKSKTLNDVCVATGSDCNAVQTGGYGYIFGLKVVDFGLISFSLFVALVIWQLFWPRKTVEILIKMGGIFAGFMGSYFISLQAFIIKRFCVYCLFVDFSGIIITLLAVYYVLVSSR